jgi:16S rRNA U516 pseudouridylate synthase RsuA-like enzyme
MERLQKILARAGLASRREAERWIADGRVAVNGTIVRRLGSQADPARDSIKVDGKRIAVNLARYYAFHKPPGIITTLNDPQRRPDSDPFIARLGDARGFSGGRLIIILRPAALDQRRRARPALVPSALRREESLPR